MNVKFVRKILYEKLLLRSIL
ncbi:unnamed protein product [Larinioides sclopetarius]|uniref:Uncharacterized protein n=1 Tax=Larinioides sclopetarius TaxID=280406 RepID=A0AAV2C080_9ARAC